MLCKGMVIFMTDEKKLKQLILTKRLVLVTMILYIAVFFVINSPYLTADNLRRFFADLTYSFRSEVSADGMKALEDDTKTSIRLFKDGYAILNSNRVVICGREGNEYSSHTLHYAAPVLKTSDQYVLCFDRGGTSICVTDSFRILFQMETDHPIINASVSDSGYVALATQRYEYRGAATVYNLEGTALARWNSDSYILDLFFGEKDAISVFSISSSGESVDTVLTVLDYREGKSTSQQVCEGLMPLAMAAKENGTVEILSDSRAIVFSADSVAVSHTYISRLPYIYYQDAVCTMLSYELGNGKQLVEAFDSNGTVLFSLEFEKIRSLCCYRNVFLVLTDEMLSVLDRTGKVLAEQMVSELSGKIIAGPDSAFFVGETYIKRLNILDAI